MMKKMNDDRLTELKTEITKAMEESIAKVLDGKSEDESLYFIRPDEASTYLETLGVVQDPCATEWLETNGWQWDFSMALIKGDKKYTLYGSGYYGGVSFMVSDDD